jgi:hypothetical protein
VALGLDVCGPEEDRSPVDRLELDAVGLELVPSANCRAGCERVLERANAGDIVLMHDGDESAPVADRRHTVEATARLIS